jgi:hypothetical protein
MSLEKSTTRIPLILFSIFVVLFFLFLYLDLSWSVKLDSTRCIGYTSNPYTECSFEINFISLVVIFYLSAIVFTGIFLFMKRVLKLRFLSK